MSQKNDGFSLLDLPQELLNRSRDMVGRGRDVWLAGLGAVAKVEEEGSNFFSNLVERGEKVEDSGKKEEDESFRLRDLPQDVMSRGREMVGMGREVWLAGLGAMSAVEEEGSTFFSNLVERGKKLEERGRQQVEAVRDELSTRQKEASERVESSIYEPLLGALKRFGVPTRAEVRELASSVDALSRKVDALLSRLEEAPAATESAAEPAANVAVFYVTARDEGWALRKEGRQSDISVHATKEEALEAARTYASERAPSRLDIYKKDGTIQDTITYGV